VAMSNGSLESTGGLRPSSHEVSAGRAFKEGVYDLGLGHTRELRVALREAPYEVPERLTELLGARAQVPGVSRAHIHPLEVPHEGRPSQLWIWLAGRCSSHVRAESVRYSGRLRMITSSVVAPPSWHARW
jgi:hypothetical protein